MRALTVYHRLAETCNSDIFVYTVNVKDIFTLNILKGNSIMSHLQKNTYFPNVSEYAHEYNSLFFSDIVRSKKSNK